MSNRHNVNVPRAVPTSKSMHICFFRNSFHTNRCTPWGWYVDFGKIDIPPWTQVLDFWKSIYPVTMGALILEACCTWAWNGLWLQCIQYVSTVTLKFWKVDAPCWLQFVDFQKSMYLEGSNSLLSKKSMYLLSSDTLISDQPLAVFGKGTLILLTLPSVALMIYSYWMSKSIAFGTV